jgi:hypothetical protein
VSLQALFFAAYAEFLAAEAARNGREKPDRVVFGIYLANRGEIVEESEADAHGPSLRLVPLRVVLGQHGASLYDIAAEIQRDLHAISSPVNVEIGLWEIKDWTEVVIESFVNFLGVPSVTLEHPPASQDAHGEQGVWLEAVETATTGTRAGDAVLTSKGDNKEEQDGFGPELAGNTVRDAFSVSYLTLLMHASTLTGR